MTTTFETVTNQIESGQLEEARRALDSLEPAGENQADLTFLRGYLKEREHDREGALAAYEEVLEQNPEHANAVFRAAWLCDQGGDDDAVIELYERLASRDEVPINVLMNLAITYEEHGRLAEAESCMQSVLETYPNHRRAQQLLKSIQGSYTMVYDEQTQRDREQRSAIADQPITDFELSVRSRNCLRQMNIRTLGDLLATSEAELLSYKNFGETSLNEIKALLSQKNLRLGQSLQPVEAPVFPPTPPAPETPETPADRSSDLFNRSVSELDLSVRSRKCLQVLGITTVGELAMRSETELMTNKNFGQTSLTEIKHELGQRGLSLRA